MNGVRIYEQKMIIVILILTPFSLLKPAVRSFMNSA